MSEEEKNVSKSLQVVICLGSNYGDREKAIRDAVGWLSGLLQETVCSEIYETPPYGSGGGAPYMNAVVKGYWAEPEVTLECLCKEYEVAYGRDRQMRLQNLVPIDIDIVMADGEILRPSDYEREFFQIGYNSLSNRFKHNR